jgi:Biopolymer transport protein
MPKVKIPRKSTAIDMTAMCDVAFLLLNFFMLTSNFIQKAPVQVVTPSSISEIKIPETNIMTILVDKTGRIFFGIDGQDKRIELLQEVGKIYNITFTKSELKTFSVIGSFGVPIEKMKTFLALTPEQRDSKESAVGIPIDSTNNQFKNWVKVARTVNPKITIAVKGDQGCSIKVIKNVMGTLQDLRENRFNLITALEEVPGEK